MLLTGGGYLQYEIRIKVVKNMAPQFNGDYKKGYDRLSDGLNLLIYWLYVYRGIETGKLFCGG